MIVTQLTIDGLLQELSEKNETISALSKENISLREQLSRERESSSRMNEDYTRVLDWQDLVVRTLRNEKMAPVYQKLYIALVDTYPDVLNGGRTAIEVWKVREAAGWASEASATKFFQDMTAIGALEYYSGKPAKKGQIRLGYVTSDPDVIGYPEKFDTKNAEKRRLARDAEEKKRKQYKRALQILQCEMCGSSEIMNDVTATCQKCHHQHAPLLNIPSSMIMIEPEVVEEADEQPLVFSEDEYTGYVGATAPAPSTSNVLEPVDELSTPDCTIPTPIKPSTRRIVGTGSTVECLLHHSPLNAYIGVQSDGEPMYGCAECAGEDVSA